jgi:hypothetical protein
VEGFREEACIAHEHLKKSLFLCRVFLPKVNVCIIETMIVVYLRKTFFK